MLDEEQGERPLKTLVDQLMEKPKLSVDRLPVLHGIFERMAAACAEAFREITVVPVTFFVNQVEVGDSWDILEAYEDSIASICLVPELESRIVVGLDRRFVYSMLEAAFGGEGSEPAYEAVRPFSVLEANIGQAMLSVVQSELAKSFSSEFPITINLERTETKLEFSTLGQRNVPAVVAQILLQVLDRGGRMFVIIPQAALVPIRRALESERAAETAARDPQWIKQLRAGVAWTDVTLQASIVGETKTLAELASLRVGDILPLRASVDSPIMLESGGGQLFSCRLGQSKGMMTVMIESEISEKDESLGDILLSTLTP